MHAFCGTNMYALIRDMRLTREAVSDLSFSGKIVEDCRLLQSFWSLDHDVQLTFLKSSIKFFQLLHKALDGSTHNKQTV